MTDNGDIRERAAAAAAVEELIPVENEGDPQTLVVLFDKRKEAEAALRVLNKALRKHPGSIYQGALVSLDEEREFKIQDLHDTGLTDIARGGADLLFDTGRDGMKLIWSTVGAGLFFFGGGWRLVRGTVRRGLGLLGTTWTIPRRRRLSSFGSGGQVEPTGLALEPGGSAMVIVADHETAAALATELVQSGGELG